MPGQVPWSAHVVRERAGRRAGLRHGATPRLSGAAHQWAQLRTDTLGAMRRARAEPTVSERAALASGRGSWERTGRQRGQATCKCGNSHRQE